MASDSHQAVIRDDHMDMFGHVNNAAYLTLYEEARWAVISPRGFSPDDIRRMQKGPIILEANVKFLRELYLGETVTITTETVSYEGKIAKMRQCMMKADGVVASEAKVCWSLVMLVFMRL